MCWQQWREGQKTVEGVCFPCWGFCGSSNGDFVLDWVWKCWNFSCWSVDPRCLMGVTGTGTPDGSFATWGDGRSHSRNSVAISGSPVDL